MNNKREKSQKSDPRALATAALTSFFRLTEKWGLSADQQRILLGSPPTSTFHKWKSEQTTSRLSRDVLERVSYLLGIHKGLNILLANPQAANEWLKKPNNAPLFNGQSALDRMLSGNVMDIAVVRCYVDAWRG